MDYLRAKVVELDVAIEDLRCFADFGETPKEEAELEFLIDVRSRLSEFLALTGSAETF